MEEMLDVVDENDKVVAVKSKSEVMRRALLHRGVVVFVFDSKNRIFVHKRTASRKIYPGMWHLAVGGSVQSGESFDEAAKREITEEIGVKNPRPKYLFSSRYKSEIDNVIAQIYRLTHDGAVVIQKEELERGSFITIAQLRKELLEKKFCPDALQYYHEMEERGLL